MRRSKSAATHRLARTAQAEKLAEVQPKKEAALAATQLPAKAGAALEQRKETVGPAMAFRRRQHARQRLTEALKCPDLKPKDIAILEEYLLEKEAHAQRIADESGKAAQANAGGKAPPKKDAKAAGKKPADNKGGESTEVLVEYPEEQVTKDPDFLIMERQFDMGAEDSASAKSVLK